jgi:hypothetical protein
MPGPLVLVKWIALNSGIPWPHGVKARPEADHNHRVEKVEDVLKIGDELEVKVNEINAQGRISLIRNDIEYDQNPAEHRPAGDRPRPPRRDGRPADR